MVLAYWCKLIDGLQASPMDFYKCIEECVKRRKIPGLAKSRVTWPEGGLFSAKREYLRLTREKLLFDICAAPFGSGFFVSCRLVDRQFPWHLLILAVVAACCLLFGFILFIILVAQGMLAAIATAVTIIPTVAVIGVVTWLLVRMLRGTLLDLDQYLSNSQAFGPAYGRVTGRLTYYRIDTILMFQAAVHSALIEVVDKHTEAQHLQPLSELERKPVLSELLLR